MNTKSKHFIENNKIISLDCKYPYTFLKKEKKNLSRSYIVPNSVCGSRPRNSNNRDPTHSECGIWLVSATPASYFVTMDDLELFILLSLPPTIPMEEAIEP